MNADKSPVKIQNELQTPTHVNCIKNPQQEAREITSPLTDDVSYKEQSSLTARGKEGKALRLRLAKSLALTSGKVKSHNTSKDENNRSDSVLVPGEEKQGKKPIANEKAKDNKFGNRILTRPAIYKEKSEENCITQEKIFVSDTTLNQIANAEARILTSSADIEIENDSTKGIKPELETKFMIKKEKKENIDWRTLLQAKPSNKRNISHIPVAMSSRDEKGQRLPSSRETKQTMAGKSYPVRKHSDLSQRKLPKVPTTSLSSVLPDKGNEISEEVEKRLEYARSVLRKQESAIISEELLKHQMRGTTNTNEVKNETGQSSKVAESHYEKLDCLENELRQFKENVSQTIEEIQKIETAAMQLRGKVQIIRAERLDLSRVVGSNERMKTAKSRTQNNDLVCNSML